ncbi:5'-3' exoribonuclease 2-like [Chiroxiphia lanceolata]|uniref:5'-3' exoribonuclease 2-like n=1 Tax=Chiroxiphia lanceolata TaxID=296741 RepID=UPI0013CED0DA|nr:5'-3' exoribonuclease 2-like [Chiroxiphia lanceolata]
MKLYRCLRAKCAHRHRGYSREISLHHGGFCSGSFSDPLGRASFSCGREGSVTYTRRPSYCPRPSYSPRPSYCPPVPASPPYSVSGGYTCGGEGSVVITSGDCGDTDALAGGGTGGPGYYGGGSGYALGGVSELSPGGAGCSQVVQQKCPVVIPSTKSQQCKQKSHWPPRQKK